MSAHVPERRGGNAEWNGSVAAPWMMATSGALAVFFVVLASLSEEQMFARLGALAGALALLALGSVRVSVTAREVTVRSAFVPFMRRRVPLSRVTGAFARRARPLELGGWGYRWRPRRTAVSLRAGEALFLQLDSGREFVITVDGAARAAEVVNSQLTRNDGE